MLGVVVGSRIGLALAMSIWQNITFHCLVLDVAAYSDPNSCSACQMAAVSRAPRLVHLFPVRTVVISAIGNIYSCYTTTTTQLGISQEPSKAAEVINGFIDDGLCSAVHEF